jgi:hypothetical protein
MKYFLILLIFYIFTAFCVSQQSAESQENNLIEEDEGPEVEVFEFIPDGGERRKRIAAPISPQRKKRVAAPIEDERKKRIAVPADS